MNRVIRQTALAAALGVCFASPVYAQSNTTGNVFGYANAGSTITVEDPSTGVRREVQVAADGSYRAASLPPGTYVVTERNADGSVSKRENIVVQLGVGTPVDFADRVTTTTSSGGTKNVGTVRVRGSRAISPIDVSSTESATILSSAAIARIPVARDTTSVALLAPGTVKGDAAFGNLASFGGASVAENQYYVNGFNVTNSFRSLNFSQVPFEGIAEQQVKTGGYGAEFGRSLGGVVNQVTKRGTNDFKGGVAAYWSPNGEARPNRYMANGELYEDNSKDSRDSWNVNLWAGGALIKNKLFAYGLIGYNKIDTDSWGLAGPIRGSDFNTSGSTKQPNWLIKLDWNINDRNTLEYTGFADTSKSETVVYKNTRGELDRGALHGTIFGEQGGINHVLNWKSFITDAFSISALYGHGEFKRNQWLETADGQDVRYLGDINVPATGCPIVIDARPGARQAITGQYASKCNITGGAIDRADSGDTRDQLRLDADWKIGSHALRFGIDIDNYESVAGTSMEGGKQWRYSTSGGRDIVRLREIRQGTTVEVKQRAFYVQDHWNVTDNFIAYLGLRWDTFQNYNGDGDKYVEIKNQLGPRLGFSWDVMGDSSFKVYGNAGRYALPLTPSVAVRGASKSLFSQSTWFFTGVDPVTGAPTGLTPRTGTIYLNAEDGRSKDPRTIASLNLKPMYQDEYILGFQKMLTDRLSIGTRAVYRNLKQAIDDNCDYAPILDALADQGYDTDNVVLPNPGFPYCRMFNPGADAVYVTDPDGSGKLYETKIKGELLSPKAKRTYQSLEVFADGHGDRYSWHASYTWSRSAGNTEGGVKSDIGQADTSVTQDFDYKELTVDTYGFLPNDRRHALKVFGNYDITPDWSVGANFLAQSGRPINCFGTLPWHGALHPYGASFMRCGGVAVPRGTAGRLPFTNSLDLNLVWTPSFVPGLTLKVDAFNVFNNVKATAIGETGEDGAVGPQYDASGKWIPIDTYRMPRAWQSPRSYRLMIQYTF